MFIHFLRQLLILVLGSMSLWGLSRAEVYAADLGQLIDSQQTQVVNAANSVNLDKQISDQQNLILNNELHKSEHAQDQAVPLKSMPASQWQPWKDWGLDVIDDHKHFYTEQVALWLGAGLVVAGVLANTRVDVKIGNYYQDHIRSSTTDDIAGAVKWLGDDRMIAAYAGISVGGLILQQDMNQGFFGWGNRSLRAVLVGSPWTLGLQRILGSPRPTDGESNWKFFKYANGVSGHAFLGGVPLFTAAQMMQNPWGKAGFYSLGLLPGLSRINDDMHYSSQVLLGWVIGLLSVNSVSATANHRIMMTPVMVSDGLGVQLSVPARF